MAEAAHRFSARMSGFVAHLRLNDFTVGSRETVTALEALTGVREFDALDARRRLKCVLARRREEWSRFDDLFDAFWLRRGREHSRPGHPGSPTGDTNTQQPSMWRDHLEDGDRSRRRGAPQRESETSGELDGDAAGRLIATGSQQRRRIDLRYVVDHQEIAQAERLAYRLASAMRYRLSRRYRESRRPRKLDLRRTIRRSLSYGGEPLRLVGKSKPERPVNIVVFLDVSGSMKHYSRFFLQFVKGLVCAWLHADAYLFHTRLVRVTDAVRERDSMKAMTRLSLMAGGFGGGTRLGESLATFNKMYAKQALDSRTVVIIMSDGYDTAPPQALAAELRRLKRRARRLVWLNPLLGWKRYQPVTAAMQAAMPFIDHFAAANTLESLAAIESELTRL